MLDIQWSPPYKYKEGFATKWRREWCIPKDKVSEFFIFWNKYRFKMLADGFTVNKSKISEKWFIFETQNDVALFKNFSDTNAPVKLKPELVFNLPAYTIKDTSGLRPWQVDASGQLVSAINQWGSAIDGSELGVGKTFTACGSLRELGLPFVIVCPKPVIFQWNKVIKTHFHMEDMCKGVINYELLIRGRKDSSIASFVLDRATRRNKFVWKVPKNTVIVWDEAHRLKNFKTRSSKTCIEANKQKLKQLFLSATLASSPLDLRTIGVCTKLFKTAGEYYQWAFDHGVYKGTWGLEFNNDPIMLKKIHEYLFKQRGVRLQRDIIPNFPETEIIVDAYNMDEEDTKKIRAVYDEMKTELKVLDKKIKSDGDSEMAIRIRALQKTELIKVPLMEEMIREGLEAGMSIVVFLNYSDSIDALASRMNTKCIYDGRNVKERQSYIELFQSNKEPLLITNIAAAREGLNLQDLDGNHPRLALLSPSYSITKLKQALGRVHRESSKSKSIQKIIYVANTQEDKVVESIGQSLENMTLINNGMITDEDLKIG